MSPIDDLSMIDRAQALNFVNICDPKAFVGLRSCLSWNTKSTYVYLYRKASDAKLRKQMVHNFVPANMCFWPKFPVLYEDLRIYLHPC